MSITWRGAIINHGDSGGPLYCHDRIAGITSCVNQLTSPSHWSADYVRADFAQSWIDRTINGWNAVAASGKKAGAKKSSAKKGGGTTVASAKKGGAKKSAKKTGKAASAKAKKSAKKHSAPAKDEQ